MRMKWILAGLALVFAAACDMGGGEGGASEENGDPLGADSQQEESGSGMGSGDGMGSEDGMDSGDGMGSDEEGGSSDD